MTALSGRYLAALPLCIMLSACSSSDKPSPYEVASSLQYDTQSSPMTFKYLADLTPAKLEREEPKQRGRHEKILPPEKPYELSEPSNAQVLREHAALNDMERLLQEYSLCPKRYAVDSVKHFKLKISIEGHCLE